MKWCIFRLSKPLIIYSVLSAVHLSLKWNKALHAVFSSFFSELIFVAVWVFILICLHMSASLLSDLNFLLAAYHWNTWYPTQITRLENKVIPVWVYGLRTGKKLYCIRMCISQSSDKFQGFKSTSRLVTSNSNSGRLLWEKILHEKKKML